MKKVLRQIVSILTVIICPLLLKAQVYTGLSAGYGLKASGISGYSYEVKDNSASGMTISADHLKISFGQGFSFDGLIGYHFKNNFGIELSLSRFESVVMKTGFKEQGTEITASYTTALTRFSPSIIISAGEGRLKPYIKFGMMIGFGDIIMQQVIIDANGTREEKYRLSGSHASGITSSLGLKYTLNRHFSFVSELNSVNMSYAPLKKVMLEYKTNGLDNMRGFTLQSKEQDLVKFYSYDIDNTGDKDKPGTELRHSYPFGRTALNLGLIYHFGSQKKTGGKAKSNKLQRPFFIRLAAGNAWALSPVDIDDFNNYIRISNNAYTVEAVNAALGKGYSEGLDFGYMFNRHIGFELGFSFLTGSPVYYKDVNMFTPGRSDFSVRAKMFRFTPELLITTRMKEISPYLKFGPLLGSGFVLMESDMVSSIDGSVWVMKSKLNGGMPVGITSTAGISIKVTEIFSAFIECTAINMSFAPSKGEYYYYTINGEDQLPKMHTNQKEANFVNHIDYNYVAQPYTEPDTRMKSLLPFSSLGINIGVAFHFREILQQKSKAL
jgi:hypothetical protein